MGSAGFRVVEQDTPEEIQACVYAILATPRASCIDDMDFGVIDPTFEALPLDDGEWIAQIEAYEPRAEATTSQEVFEDVAEILVKVGQR